jgi:hypothetical protein
MPKRMKPEAQRIEEQKDNEPEFDLEAATARVVEACDGDLRAAIRSLILANNHLTQELEYVWYLVSPGYSRQKWTRRRSTGAG